MSERERKELGRRIRMLRSRQNVSQSTFAKMVHIDRGYFIGIEHGKKNPSLDMIVRIANGLDVDLPTLFDGVGAKKPGGPGDSTYEYRHIVI